MPSDWIDAAARRIADEAKLYLGVNTDPLWFSGIIREEHAKATPKLIESGPLPAGRMFVAIPKPNCGVTQPVAITDGAPNPNYAAFRVYDYGPPPPQE